MADQAILKHVSEDTVPEIVQQPWQIKRFSNTLEKVALPPAVQQPWQIGRFSNDVTTDEIIGAFSNLGRSGGSQTLTLCVAGSQSSATLADQVVLKRDRHRFRRFIRSATLADQVVLKHGRLPRFPCDGSATLADQVVLKLASVSIGASAVQQPWQIRWFSNTVRIELMSLAVQQPWQIRWFSNLWVWICRLIWAFLFQRTAKSARSSCFCDPPGRFFDRALGSPQAYIPAPTAVWVHYSRTIP